LVATFRFFLTEQEEDDDEDKKMKLFSEIGKPKNIENGTDRH
jgi:hypothetical protein